MRTLPVFDRRIFMLGGIAAAACSGAVNAPLTPIRRDSIAWLRSGEFDTWVQSRMEEAHIPGLSLAIIERGKLLRTAAFGWASLEKRHRMSTRTLINIASCTKTVTGAAVMQLWEAGKFALDDDVNAFLPFRVHNPRHPTAAITFRQLLTHSSSIADGPSYEKIYACGDHPTPMATWLQDYLSPGGRLYDAGRNFREWAPGAYAAYSNVGYGLLGLLIERMSGMSYVEYCRRRILDPLGMRESRFLLGGMPEGAHATPYVYGASNEPNDVLLRDPQWRAKQPGASAHVPLCLYSFVTASDGLLRTNAEELSLFLLAMLNAGAYGGRRILKAETVALILSDQKVEYVTSDGSHAQDTQGLTWFGRHDYLPSHVWSHSGGDPGIGTHMAIRPEDGRGVLVLTNLGGDDLNLRKDIARLVLEAR